MVSGPSTTLGEASIASLSVSGPLAVCRDVCRWIDIDLEPPYTLPERHLDLVVLDNRDDSLGSRADVATLLAAAAARPVPVAVWHGRKFDDDWCSSDGDLEVGHFCIDPGVVTTTNKPPLTWLPHTVSSVALEIERERVEYPVGIIATENAPWMEQFPALVSQVVAQISTQWDCAGFITNGCSDVPAHIRIAGSGCGQQERADFIAKCGVVIGGPPTGVSSLFVPDWVFDAVAIGVPTLFPSSWGLAYTVPRLTIPLLAVKDAVARVERILAGSSTPLDVTRHGRSAVRNEHTVAHRLATMLSAFGHRLLPTMAS